MQYYVTVHKGWSYVIDAVTGIKHDGPYRYRWEAQERCDELNGKPGDVGDPSNRVSVGIVERELNDEIAKLRAEVERLRNENAHLQFSLNSRDEYIVSIDHWSKYTGTLPCRKAGVPGGWSDGPYEQKEQRCEACGTRHENAGMRLHHVRQSGASEASSGEQKATRLPVERCDQCDNGLEPSWEYCAYCAHPIIKNRRS